MASKKQQQQQQQQKKETKRTTFSADVDDRTALEKKLDLLEARFTQPLDASDTNNSNSQHSFGFEPTTACNNNNSKRVSTSPISLSSSLRSNWQDVALSHMSKVAAASRDSIVVHESPEPISNKTNNNNKRKSNQPVKRTETTRNKRTRTLQFDTTTTNSKPASKPTSKKSSPIKSFAPKRSPNRRSTSPLNPSSSNSRDGSRKNALHNNTRIDDFFGKSLSNTKKRASSSAPPPTLSQQLEHWKQKYQALEKNCQDQSAQLSAVSNNRTILHTALQKKMAQREAQIETLKQSHAKRDAQTLELLENHVRSQAEHDTHKLRQQLTADGQRLGRIVTSTASRWGRPSETWEDGSASQSLSKEKERLAQEKKLLEQRQKDARKAEQLVKAKKKDCHMIVGGVLIQTPLDALEATENVRRHLQNWRKLEKELVTREAQLHDEKGHHIRALKRLAFQDNSRFRHRPKLHQRYVLQQLLGKGGFSEVWKAYDLQQLREVAVKIHSLDPRWPDHKKENYTKHVSREYEIHRTIQHQRIVQLYDVFEIDTNSFATVLEVCHGTDLDTLLKQQRQLPERDARAILLQILSAMKYLSEPSADRQGIIHYDLKPGNILFDQHGDAKVTDFGLSKIVEHHDPSQSMELTSQGAGTYWYLPPECFVTDDTVRISNKVDVWSIGVIYYQMLFGKRPFGDNQTQDRLLADGTMLNARTVTFPASPEISQGAQTFIRDCLTYDQTFRPSIAQLCENPYVLRKELA